MGGFNERIRGRNVGECFGAKPAVERPGIPPVSADWADSLTGGCQFRIEEKIWDTPRFVSRDRFDYRQKGGSSRMFRR